MRILSSLLIFVVVGVGILMGLYSFRNAIAEKWLFDTLKYELEGFATNWRELQVDVEAKTVTLSGVTIRNPGSYKYHDLLIAPKAVMSANPQAVQSLNARVWDQVTVDIERIAVVSTKTGKVNIEDLPGLKLTDYEKTTVKTVSHQDEIESFLIKDLIVSVKEVAVYDYETQENPQPQIFPINISNRSLGEVRSWQSLQRKIIGAALLEAGVTTPNLPLKNIQDLLGNASSAAAP